MEDKNKTEQGRHVSFLFNVSNPDLTSDQSNHVTKIAKYFCLAMAKKYVEGQKEHGGNLWDLSTAELLDNAILEAIDQVVYLVTAREKLGDV